MTTKNALVRQSETLRQENLPTVNLSPPANAQADVLFTQPPYKQDGICFNFRVDPEFKARFKAAAALQRMTANKLLKQLFEEWEAKNKSGTK